MNKYILAVSGGVDSVVLLDMFATGRLPIRTCLGPSATTYYLLPTTYEIIVAHFDHGIREDSAIDAKFVGDLAKKYGLKFETKREELGQNASEELARDRRYEFLRSVAKKYSAKLVTAHHSDDIIESIAINLIRGTGWRGLAVMDSDIYRPLFDMTKSEVIKYAKKNNLEWHDDSTNSSEVYLRNRIRKKIIDLDEDSKRQLLGLWVNQKSIKEQINKETEYLTATVKKHDRHFYINIDNKSAMECLRQITNGLLTRPQLANLLVAIKTFPPKKTVQAGNGVKIAFTHRNFTVELLK